MEPLFNCHPLPENCRRIKFCLNKLGHYAKEPDRLAFTKLPEWLRVELAQTEAPKVNGAQTVIHGPQRGGKYTFYTGLRETGIQNWFYGNDYEFRKGQKTNSLCLFHFADNDRILIVYYYTGWYFNGREKLETIVRGLIPKLLQNESGK